jgi:hypothetical protein
MGLQRKTFSRGLPLLLTDEDAIKNQQKADKIVKKP